MESDLEVCATSHTITSRGGAVWQLVGLITRRSQVQILSPQPFSIKTVGQPCWPAVFAFWGGESPCESLLNIKTPHLFRNRLGTFYFRFKHQGQDHKFSLRTKCASTASILAIQLNQRIKRDRSMSKPKLDDFDFDDIARRQYELLLPNGVRLTATDEADHQRAMEAIDKIASLNFAAPAAGLASAPVAMPLTLPLSDVVVRWLAERALKNKPRTVYAKKCHLKNFEDTVGSHILINTVAKQTVVGFKSALQTEKQTGKTIDNKLMSLHDFFKYAIANGFYTASNTNPVEGLFVTTKASRKTSTIRYQPFTISELKRVFESSTYVRAMNAPDLFWAPLLALFTGMRIGEVTQLRCDDIKANKEGIPYIFIRDSKTLAGIRDFPVSSTLQTLGFLTYVDEVRAGGAKRLFPHRSYVNHSYAKRLSEVFGKYLAGLGVATPESPKSFHSFRVNVITAMADDGANTTQSMKMTGHRTSEADDVHFGYVRDLPSLRKIADNLKWPIDVDGLKYDGRFAKFVADKKQWKADGPTQIVSSKRKTVSAAK